MMRTLPAPALLACAVLAFAVLGLALLGPAAAALACPPGFAALQNSDACVRLSGRVGADALVGSPRSRASDSVETQVRGRVQLEVRKPTEYGPLRAVIRADGVRH
jgi:hypothetical protein